MTSLSHRITQFADRFPKLAALILGLVSATGFAPLNLWPLTLIALAAWMALVARTPRGWRVFGIGWTFGVGHFTLGLNWIAISFTYQAAMPAWLGWVAVLLVALYLAIYPALTAWGAWWFASRNRPARTGMAPSYIFAFAALWVLTEWLRSWMFSGFAWNPLAASLSTTMLPNFFLTMIGTYGFGAIVILLAALVGRAIVAATRIKTLRRPRSGTMVGLGFGIVFLVPVLVSNLFPALMDAVFGAYIPPVSGTPITVVQPNVGQEDKWVGAKADANFAKLAQLTSDPAEAPPRLILWPEAAIPDYLETGYPLVYYDRSPAEARGRLTNLMRSGDLLLLGALKLELDPKTGQAIGARNAVMIVHPDGTLGARYDKSHLVPYGEYLPMRGLLSAIGLSRLTPGDLEFWPGPGARTLDLGQFGKAGIQICYEIIFSGQVVDRAHRPDFIFNPSNDAWFGAWGPPQHLAQARLRAIEEGLPVVRATPTGISAVIDADGRVLASIPQHVAGRIDTNLPTAHAPTLFARYGNILPLIFALLLLLAAIAFRRRGR